MMTFNYRGVHNVDCRLDCHWLNYEPTHLANKCKYLPPTFFFSPLQKKNEKSLQSIFARYTWMKINISNVKNIVVDPIILNKDIERECVFMILGEIQHF